eukprot:1156988-Pelagomonas_calceolata.AAC.3
MKWLVLKQQGIHEGVEDKHKRPKGCTHKEGIKASIVHCRKKKGSPQRNAHGSSTAPQCGKVCLSHHAHMVPVITAWAPE